MAEGTSASGQVKSEMDEAEKQFLADLEKAKALSMETAALEKFRHMTPPSNDNVGGGQNSGPSGPTSQRRATYHHPASKVNVDNGEGRTNI